MGIRVKNILFISFPNLPYKLQRILEKEQCIPFLQNSPISFLYKLPNILLD